MGVRVADVDQWASVVHFTGDEVALLQIDADAPALLFQRVTRDPAGTPVEYVRSPTAATATRSTPAWSAGRACPTPMRARRGASE